MYEYWFRGLGRPGAMEYEVVMVRVQVPHPLAGSNFRGNSDYIIIQAPDRAPHCHSFISVIPFLASYRTACTVEILELY